MLNSLDLLAQRLEQALSFTRTLLQSKHDLEQEVAQLRTDAEVLRAERDAMLVERERLTSKIEDAQARIQSILDKLPPDDTARQLDLLNPAQSAPAAEPQTGTASAYAPNYTLIGQPGAPL